MNGKLSYGFLAVKQLLWLGVISLILAGCNQKSATDEPKDKSANKQAVDQDINTQATNKTTSADDTLRFINGTYACQIMQAKGSFSLVGGQNKNAKSSAAAVELLNNKWDVHDKASGMLVVQQIINKGLYTPLFMDEVRSFNLNRMSDEQFQKLVAGVANQEDAAYLKFLYNAYKDFGGRAVVGWDVSEVNGLLANLFLADYIDASTDLDKALEITKNVQAEFNSWDEYNKSYQYGYQFWLHHHPEESTDKAQQQQAMLDKLKKDSKSPFQIKWDTELQKTW